jgi:diamine N-acetyltransferase
MIRFHKITKKNVWNIIELTAGEEGKKHVALNSHTLIEAIFDNKLSFVKAIYYNDKLIGLTYFYPSRNIIFISRFMIDDKYQGKGYGSKAFEKLIEFIKNKHSPLKIEVSTSNPIAINLYKKFGFIDTNNQRTQNFYKKYNEYILTLTL